MRPGATAMISGSVPNLFRNAFASSSRRIRLLIPELDEIAESGGNELPSLQLLHQLLVRRLDQDWPAALEGDHRSLLAAGSPGGIGARLLVLIDVDVVVRDLEGVELIAHAPGVFAGVGSVDGNPVHVRLA